MVGAVLALTISSGIALILASTFYPILSSSFERYQINQAVSATFVALENHYGFERLSSGCMTASGNVPLAKLIADQGLDSKLVLNRPWVIRAQLVSVNGIPTNNVVSVAFPSKRYLSLGLNPSVIRGLTVEFWREVPYRDVSWDSFDKGSKCYK